MNKYFLQRDGRTFGPYSLDDLKRYLGEGRIGPSDMIREGDDGQFMPQSEFFARFAPDAPVAMTLPSFKAPKPTGPVLGQSPVTPTPAAPVANTPPAAAPQASPFAAPAASPFGAPATPQAPTGTPAGSTPSSPFGGNESPFGAPASKPADQMFPPLSSGPEQSSPFGGAPGQGPFGSSPAQQPFGGGFGQMTPPASSQGFGGGSGIGAPNMGGPGMSGPNMGGPQGFGGPQGYAAQGGAVPSSGGVMPPNMQWWLVLIISMVCGLFSLYWLYQIVTFAQQIDPNSKAKKNYLLGILLAIVGYVVVLVGAIAGAAADSVAMSTIGSLVGMVAILAGVVFVILGHFDVRKSMEQYYNSVENIGLKLNPVFTFFFNIYYFTYHFNRITKWKTTGVLQ